MEIISFRRIKKIKKTDLFKNTIFRTLREPIIKIKQSLKANSLHSAIRRRKKDIENYFNNINIENKNDLINYDISISRRKKSPKIKRRSFFPFSEEKKNSTKIIFKRNKFSETFNSFTNFTTDKNTNNITKDNSNIFLTNIKEKENSKDNKIISLKTVFDNKPGKISLKRNNIRLFINNSNSEKFQLLPKKFLINCNIKTNFNLKNKKLFHSQNNLNLALNEKNKFLKKSNLTFSDILFPRRKSMFKKLMEIEIKNKKTNNQLKKLIEDSHFFPVISDSFKADMNAIIDKTIQIKKNGTYKIKDLHNNENFKKIFEKYWDYNNQKIRHNVFKERQQHLWDSVSNQIHKDLVKAEKMNLNIKYDPTSSFSNMFMRNFDN
jgi:hypothetical protein